MKNILAGLTFLSLLLILFGINRGFDFSDEGLYVLLAVPNQANDAGIFNYDLFFKLFYKITGLEFGVVGMRILHLVSYLIAAFSLTVFWKNLNQSKTFSICTYLIALLGLLSGYAFLPPSLSYNSLSVFWATVILAILSTNGIPILSQRWIQFIALGISLTAFFYIKITVCLSLSLLSIVYLVIRKDFNWKVFLALLIPFLSFELVFYSFLGESGILRIIQGYDQIQSRNDYHFISLIKYTAVGVYWVVLVGSPFLALAKIDKRKVGLRRTLTVIGICLLLLISYFTFITKEWNHIVVLCTSVLIAWQLGLLKKGSLNSNQKLWLGILLAMPFLLHFGSNVYFLRLGIHYWVFWVLALYFISLKNGTLFSSYPKIVFGLTVFVLVLNGIWLNPFEQEPLWKANKSWEYGEGKVIMLSEKQVKLLEVLKVYTENKNSVLAFYRAPGLVYLLGKTIPKSPGLWDKKQVEFYFPAGIQDNLILYQPHDSLPEVMKPNYQKKILTMPDGAELQVLWKD